jgi:hypothetical protein
MSVFFLTDWTDDILVLLDMTYTNSRTISMLKLQVFVKVVLLVELCRALITYP